MDHALVLLGLRTCELSRHRPAVCWLPLYRLLQGQKRCADPCGSLGPPWQLLLAALSYPNASSSARSRLASRRLQGGALILTWLSCRRRSFGCRHLHRLLAVLLWSNWLSFLHTSAASRLDFHAGSLLRAATKLLTLRIAFASRHHRNLRLGPVLFVRLTLPGCYWPGLEY